ncbi:MAG: BREX-1 system adenine-specific DNA-methyltransferase PglX [Chromatiaceae bacterium]|jgi:hypothetical protein|nr:BREX-1 system adenine-specific DNA-methyltransferase PglX [Chromatiaceae bacterium]
MDTGNIKRYAPKARRDFIAAVTRRAAKFGLTATGASPVREEGQLVFIKGQAYPKTVGVQRRTLADRIRQQGFEQVMEAAAYTWFNRFAAIRFMELHGYLDHSFRVLSHPAGNGLPEILEHAHTVDLPGLDRKRVVELKMDGTRDEALYRHLLLAQCRALHQAMPFLFEPVDDETEMLLSDNLLQTDSVIREQSPPSPRPTGRRSRSSAGSTSSTSRRRRTRSSARWLGLRTSPPRPSSSPPTGSSSTWSRTGVTKTDALS